MDRIGSRTMKAMGMSRIEYAARRLRKNGVGSAGQS